MVNLKSGDSLKFGKSFEYVFEMMPSIVQQKMPPSEYVRQTNTSSTDDSSSGRNSNVSLPIVGHRIVPKAHREKFVRSAIINQCLCKLKNAPHMVISQDSDQAPKQPAGEFKRSSSSTTDDAKKRKSHQQAALLLSKPDHPGPLQSVFRNKAVNKDLNKWTDLVQRIVRLQNELHRKDVEIALLKKKAHQKQALPQPKAGSLSTDEDISQMKKFNSTIELVYDTFFKIVSKEVEGVGKRFSLDDTVHDYGDIFREIYSLLEEPFSYRLVEINTKCNDAFEHLQISLEEKERLCEELDGFFRDKLGPISKAFDALLPILKEATYMARNSAKACSIFSQWSREFGDQLQMDSSIEHMAYKVDDLQTRFCEHGLNRHWLPPNIMPLLKTFIYEIQNKAEELARREREYSITSQRLIDEIAQQKIRINQPNPEIVEESKQQAATEEHNPAKRFKKEERPWTAVGTKPPLLDMDPISKQQRKHTDVSLESCSQNSKDEVIESDGEYEAHTQKIPEFVSSDPEICYDDEENNPEDITLKINKEVVGLPKIVSGQEGACESTGQNIRDCRNPPPNEENEDERRRQEGNDSGPPNNGENKKDGDDNEEDRRHSRTDSRAETDFEEETKSNRSSNHIEDDHSSSIRREQEGDNLADLEEDADDMEIRDTVEANEGILNRQPTDRLRPVSGPAHFAYGHEEREQNTIEFWELAQLLARALKVDLPDHGEADFSSIDLDEGTQIDRNRRELAVNAIMDKINEILERIQKTEEQRSLADRRQSIRSNKSLGDEYNKPRSGYISNTPKWSGERSFHKVESIVEGESAL